MFKSKLSLCVALDRFEIRNVIPEHYQDGVLTVRIPTKLGKDTELYMAIAYIGKQVFSRVIINSKEEKELSVPIGEITGVYFGSANGGKNMFIAVRINTQYTEAFNTLAI